MDSNVKIYLHENTSHGSVRISFMNKFESLPSQFLLISCVSNGSIKEFHDLMYWHLFVTPPALLPFQWQWLFFVNTLYNIQLNCPWYIACHHFFWNLYLVSLCSKSDYSVVCESIQINRWASVWSLNRPNSTSVAKVEQKLWILFVWAAFSLLWFSSKTHNMFIS